jgi:hypothetical protein
VRKGLKEREKGKPKEEHSKKNGRRRKIYKLRGKNNKKRIEGEQKQDETIKGWNNIEEI